LKKRVSGRFFVNEQATWDEFNSAAGKAALLHIGSHAMTISGDSLPFLLLYDKPFYLFDLRYKTFGPALVVLGACRTGSGVLLEGEGVNSLSRGFTAAGAGGVFSGLWNVNDETAIAFMQSYYHHLKYYDPAGALRMAKLSWLSDHRNKTALQLPYYWAGFIYSGHLQKVKFNQPAKTKPWWFRLALVLLALILIFLFRFILLRYKQKK
jgi:CHAT domain-containing protein